MKQQPKLDKNATYNEAQFQSNQTKTRQNAIYLAKGKERSANKFGIFPSHLLRNHPLPDIRKNATTNHKIIKPYNTTPHCQNVNKMKIHLSSGAESISLMERLIYASQGELPR